jgi:isoamylase
VTCHDGFTLCDLVSYNRKHNRANHEGNRDGTSDNLSWNCGLEGETALAEVIDLRQHQAKNVIAILMLSQGIPMLLAGDEVLRSQGGNNNAWCQDNTLGWFDWSLAERNADMLRFVRGLIALRKRHPSLQRRHFLSGRVREGSELPDIAWHGVDLDAPEWLGKECRTLAFTLAPREKGEGPLHVMLNMGAEGSSFAVPGLAAYRWRLAVDTAAESPADLFGPAKQPPFTDRRYTLAARSVVVLEGR